MFLCRVCERKKTEFDRGFGGGVYSLKVTVIDCYFIAISCEVLQCPCNQSPSSVIGEM